MLVDVVDPSAYTPPYDHALCAALARAGADVTAGDEPVRVRRRHGAARLPRRRALLSARSRWGGLALAAGRQGARARARNARLPPFGRRRCRPLPVADDAVARRASAAAVGPGRADVARSAAARGAPRSGGGAAAGVRVRRRRRGPLAVRPLVAGRSARGRCRARPRDPSRRVRASGGAAAGAARAVARGRRAPRGPVLRPTAALQGPRHAARGVAGRGRRRAVDRRAAADGVALGVGARRSFRAPVRLRSRAGGVLPPRRHRGAAVLADRAAGLLGRARDRAWLRPRNRPQRRGRSRRGGGAGRGAARRARRRGRAARCIGRADRGPAVRASASRRAHGPQRTGRTPGTSPAARRWRYTGRSAPARAASERRWTSVRTSGATSVPNSSIERSTSLCATAPTLIWPM